MIAIIVAMDQNGVIGKNNALPWYYPEDLKFFKRKTLNHTVIMGRKTYDSIIDTLGKPLPNRKNVVLTTQKKPRAGVDVIHDLTSYLHTLNPNEKHFVIGGKSVYEQTLPYADVLYITKINQVYDGDTYFPDYNKENYILIETKEDGPLTFETYLRKEAKNHDHITL